MPDSLLPVVFTNAAGEVLEHPAGYALIRYRAGKRAPGDLAAILTQTGALMLRRRWPNLISDTRLMAPLTEAEKDWIVANWQGHQIARPPRMRVGIVLAADVFTRLAVGQVQVGVQPGNIEYKNCRDLDEAQQFILG